jgi:P27 family predicted phage terminase small subunit
MSVGRKRTPTHLRLLQGNPGKRPIRDEPQPFVPAEAPAPPPFLDAYATEEWLRLAAELHRMRLLTIVDLAALAAYCTAYSRWRNAEEVLKRMSDADPVMRGLIIKSNKTGSAIENPLAYIARKAAQEMLRFAVEFGFTPAARSRIAAGVGAPPMQTKFGDLLA